MSRGDGDAMVPAVRRGLERRADMQTNRKRLRRLGDKHTFSLRLHAARPHRLLALILLGTGLLLQQAGHLHSQWGTLLLPRQRQLSGLQPDAANLCFGTHSDLPTLSTTLIAASSNRTDAILRVLPSWLRVIGLDEIVLVDWGSSPPLHVMLPPQLLSDRRLRIVRAKHERRWSLARAYNLAAQFARGSVLFKVDADTLLHEEAITRQRLPASGLFRRGCRHEALSVRNSSGAGGSANLMHLNGVAIVRRADFFSVLGYDERMADYGYDDTDLYKRLTTVLNLSYECLAFTLMGHVATRHPHRGLSRVSHIINRRGAGDLFSQWHLAQDPPSAWQVDSNGDVASSRYGGGADAATAGAAAVMAVGSSAARSAAGASRGLRVDRVVAPPTHSTLPRNVCEVVCTQQPPYFTEMLSNSETLGAHRQALQAYSRHAISRSAALQLTDLEEIRGLMTVYDHIAFGGAWVAVRVTSALPSRLQGYCSAAAFAEQSGRRTLLIWEPDAQLAAHFDDLFATAAESSVGPHVVLRKFTEAAFPASAWVWLKQTGEARGDRSQLLTANDVYNRSLMVTSSGRVDSSPPVQRQRYRHCLATLGPVAHVSSMLLPSGGADGLAQRVGVHVTSERPTQGEAAHSASAASTTTAAAATAAAAAATDAAAAATGAAAAGEAGATAHHGAERGGDDDEGEEVESESQRAGLMDDGEASAGQQCGLSAFVTLMASRRASTAGTSFYVAADADSVEIDSITKQFEPGTVARLDESAASACSWPLSRAGVACARAALADMLNTARCGRLVLSLPSAWEEVVIALAPPGITHEYACQRRHENAWHARTQAKLAGGQQPSLPAPKRTQASRTVRAQRFEPKASWVARERESASREGAGDARTETEAKTTVGARKGNNTTIRRQGDQAWSPEVDGVGREPVGRGDAGAFPSAAPSLSQAPSLASDTQDSDDTAVAAAQAEIQGRHVPGLRVKRLSSTTSLPNRKNDVRVLLHKTPALFEVLPQSMHALKLLFLVPSRFRAASLAKRLRAMLRLDTLPCFRLHPGETQGGGAAADTVVGQPGLLLDEAASLGALAEKYKDSDGLLHVFADLKAACKQQKMGPVSE